ncbi:MAG TPA: 3-oxoacyl-ACP synthase, partial [Phaeodactylibacter sp.]|nr:3-oxoacyl-ACP synthase [Phaeodactylibacter sp.]
DKLSAVVDYTDRSTCILFGDGAGAVMLEPSEQPVGVLDYILKSDGSGRDLLYQKAGGSLYPCSKETLEKGWHYIYQDGRKVFKYAVEGMKNTLLEVMKRNDLTKDDIKWLVPHQANMRIIEYVAKMADFPMERVMINIDKYGNTTSATIPLCLWNYEDQIKPGDKLLLTAFGGGFSWGSILVEWGKPGK